MSVHYRQYIYTPVVTLSFRGHILGASQNKNRIPGFTEAGRMAVVSIRYNQIELADANTEALKAKRL